MLRVKDTFPGERAVDLLNELVEPPGSEQLDAAFTKLKENGALLSLPSDARKAIREATEVPGATFAEPRHKKSKVVGGGVVSVDPEQADRVDAEEGIVTFLGRAYPAVGAELTQVKMLLIASASGCAVEGAVLAAALSAQDVFSLPFPTHSKDREKLQKFLGASFAGRLTADGGSHSEPIGLLEVFARWLDTPTDGQQRRSLLFSYSLHQQRFRHFRALCSTFALRLAHLLEKFVLLEDTKGKRPGPQHASQSGLGQSGARATTPEDILATRSTVARLRALAAVAYETDFRLSDRRKLYQDLGLPFTEDQKEFPIASHLFFAPRDHLRSLLLVCCAPNVFQARPADTATDALRSAVGKLDRHRKWALGLSQYGGPGGVSNNVAEKAFSSEVVGFSADGWASDETDKDVSNGSLGLLRNFAYGTAAENLGVRPVGADPVVPGLVTKKQNQAAQTPAPSGMSFAASPKMMSSLRARYRDLDPRHTVVITLNDKCPMGLRSADAIRSTFAWIGAERVTAVEVAKGKKILQAYVVEFDPSGSWGSHLQADAEDPDSIFHVWNQTGYGARLAYYLCMGRPWALALPIPGGGGLDSRRPALVGSSNTAGSHSAMNMGADVGSIAVPGALAFSSANPIHAKMQLRTYWRSPSVSGLGFVLLTDDPGASDLAKAPENGAELVKQLQRPIQILHRKRGLGRPAYAIAGSIMIVGETTSFRGQTNPSTLNLTTVTLIPADEPAWNLRLLAISNDPESCYLRLEDPLHASALRHPFWDYAQSELKPNLKNFAKTMRVAQMEHDAQLVKESFGGKGRKMRREELDVVNQVRTALRNVMIRGVGLSTATSELGRSLFDGIDEAGRAIKARGQEGEVPLITLPKTLGKPTQEGPYWAKFAAEPDAVGQKANSDATGLEAKVGSMSIGAGLPTEFAFFFDSVSTAGDVSRGILPDAAMLAIEQSFLPPFAWPKWDPPQAPPPSAFGFGYGMPSGFARGGNVSSYVEDSEDEMFDDEDSEDSSDYY